MTKTRTRTLILVAVLLAVVIALAYGWQRQQQTPGANGVETQAASADDAAAQSGADDAEAVSNQKEMTFEEYIDAGGEQWFLTGKKQYPVQAMMVSKETSFHNDLEVVDYTVTDDGTTVILKGTVGEMWATSLSKVLATYTKPDGSALSEADFAEKDVYIDIVSIPSPDSNYAMFVPADTTVTVQTAWGDVLHTNLPNAPHGDGDYLVCRVGEDGEPDLSDVWVLNGEVFPNTYDTSHLEELEEAA